MKVSNSTKELFSINYFKNINKNKEAIIGEINIMLAMDDDINEIEEKELKKIKESLLTHSPKNRKTIKL